MMQLKKIVVIGPESTGKSSLCAQLAAHYKTAWVKEYAREYLLANGTNYSFENLLDVARGQVNQEEREILQFEVIANQITFNDYKNKAAAEIKTVPLFIDTDMQVLRVWCEFVFGKCHHWILNQIVERSYDLYLLCNIDLAWVKDELREYPDLTTREKLYHHYKDTMVNQDTPWIDISGSYDERLAKAIVAVDALVR